MRASAADAVRGQSMCMPPTYSSRIVSPPSLVPMSVPAPRKRRIGVGAADNGPRGDRVVRLEVELDAQQDVERPVIAREVLEEQDLRVRVALPADEVAAGVADDAFLADDAARRIERIAGALLRRHDGDGDRLRSRREGRSRRAGSSPSVRSVPLSRDASWNGPSSGSPTRSASSPNERPPGRSPFPHVPLYGGSTARPISAGNPRA